MGWNNVYRKMSNPERFGQEVKFHEMTLSKAQDAAATVMATSSSENEKIEALGRFFIYKVMPQTKKGGKLPRSQSGLRREFDSLLFYSGLDDIPEEDDPRYETFMQGVYQAGQEMREEQKNYWPEKHGETGG